jgi:predicted MPP superfamily phosphohydrolase
MRSRRIVWIVVIIAILLDLYVFQAVKSITSDVAPRWRTIIFSGYWGLSVLTLIVFCLLPLIRRHLVRLQGYIFFTVLGLYFAKLLASLFLLIDDGRRLVQWATGRFFSHPGATGAGPGVSPEGIPRSVFLSWLAIGIAAGLFSTLVYGFSNKYNYRVRRIRLAYDNLPAAFNGLKIVQLSDIHSGSFGDKAAVSRGVDKILAESPDLILFTGDLVNDRAVEMTEYKDVFARLKAPMGVFSTLGNHDYGDYVGWATPEEKAANLEQLKQIQQDMGWRLLMNEHVALERGGQYIALIGIENWSAKARFPKYGKMNQAWPGTEKYPFKILMSHDPSHWDAEVRPHYPDIDLTLAGHTHGMQFGIELRWLKWSPVQYLYKEWAGLHEKDRQKLYVNRGFGFIGYPGRVGILPEITVIELTG